MTKPYNSILVKRLVKYPGPENSCVGEVINSCNHDFKIGQKIHYKLIDKKYYSISSNMENFDYLRLDCIFGVD